MIVSKTYFVKYIVIQETKQATYFIWIVFSKIIALVKILLFIPLKVCHWITVSTKLTSFFYYLLFLLQGHTFIFTNAITFDNSCRDCLLISSLGHYKSLCSKQNINPIKWPNMDSSSYKHIHFGKCNDKSCWIKYPISIMRSCI